MRLTVKPTKAQAAIKVARRIANLIREDLQYNQNKPSTEQRKTVLGLATGGTQEAVYAELVRMYEEEGLDFSNVVTFNLDEYVGVGPGDERSYAYYMHHHLFNHVNIEKENIHLLDGRITDPVEQDQHLKQYEMAIKEAGGIRLQLLGIGVDGHLAFVEHPKPGKNLKNKKKSRTQVRNLRDSTRKANAMHCGGIDKVPTQALTMGLATIAEAQELLLLATGENKNPVIKKLFSEDNENIPATILWEHVNARMIADDAAAHGIASSAIGTVEVKDPRKPIKLKLSSKERIFSAKTSFFNNTPTDVLLKQVTSIGLLREQAETDLSAWVKNGDLYIGSFAALKQKAAPNTPIIDLPRGEELFILPGFFDRHVHGFKGYNFLDGTPEAIYNVTQELAKRGTTHCMATLMTAKDDDIEKAVQAIAQHVEHYTNTTEPLTKIVGIHLEGPFISNGCRGAHSEHLLQTPYIEWLDKLIALAPDLAWSITVAPELPGAINFIKQARQRGVKIFIGHTAATSIETIKAAENAGAVGYTHLPNAMAEKAHYDETPIEFSQLKSPIVQHALTDKKLFAEVIFDFIHTTESFAEYCLQGLGSEKIILVTDSTAVTGQPDGEHYLGHLSVVKKGYRIASTENGKLAGSGVVMEDCVRNFSVLLSKRPLSDEEYAEIMHHVTSRNAYDASVPAEKQIDLEPSKNFVIMNRQGDVVGIVCNGQWVRQAFTTLKQNKRLNDHSERNHEKPLLEQLEAILTLLETLPEELSKKDLVRLFNFEGEISLVLNDVERNLSAEQNILFCDMKEKIIRTLNAENTTLFKSYLIESLNIIHDALKSADTFSCPQPIL